MNCKRAQAEIALLAGGDLDDAAEALLDEHLASCSSCRRHWNEMQATLLVLHEPEVPADPLHDSVWPTLSMRLSRERRAERVATFNGWVAGLAVAATVLAMISLWSPPVTGDASMGERTSIAAPVSPVAWPARPGGDSFAPNVSSTAQGQDVDEERQRRERLFQEFDQSLRSRGDIPEELLRKYSDR
ncbi:MAG: zf-HC2 domain-containing protein [Planctomycetes bacterium]|nr:zf-HC2 domain-containing protein [Planctomycetota bacterium]